MTCLLVQTLHKCCSISNFILKHLFLCLTELYITMDMLFRCISIWNWMIFPLLLISLGFPTETQIRVTMFLFRYWSLLPFPPNADVAIRMTCILLQAICPSSALQSWCLKGSQDFEQTGLAGGHSTSPPLWAQQPVFVNRALEEHWEPLENCQVVNWMSAPCWGWGLMSHPA